MLKISSKDTYQYLFLIDIAISQLYCGYKNLNQKPEKAVGQGWAEVYMFLKKNT